MVLGLLVAGSTFSTAQNPAPVQKFYIPLPADQILSTFQALTVDLGPTLQPLNPMQRYTVITAVSDGTIIYYDHAENGYDSNPSNPANIYNAVTNPGGTQIWGDGDPSNGAPPGNPTDSINAGTKIVMANSVDTTVAPDPDAPVFRAGDRISSNKTIAVTTAIWATQSQTLLADGVEVFDTFSWGTDYRIPVGVDIPSGDDFEKFEYVGATIMAGQGGATIQIDANADGTFETTVNLNEGEAHHINNGLNVDARIISNNPVQVDVLTGDINEGYESRFFRLLPTNLWTNRYYTPVSTPTTVQGTSGVDTTVWLYNPGTDPINVTYTRRGGSNLISNVGNNTLDYNAVPLTGTSFGNVYGPIVELNSDGTLPGPSPEGAWIGIVDRSAGNSPTIESKVTNAISAGAAAVMIVRNDSGTTFETAGNAVIPVVGMLQVDGAVLRTAGIGAGWVRVSGDQGSSTVAVPAGGYARQVLTDGYGARFFTVDEEPFYAISTTDSTNPLLSDTSFGGNRTWDWGYSLIPDSSLTPQLLIGLGIGRDPTSSVSPNENGSPVWVTTVGNENTDAIVYVDFDADPTTGAFTDPNGFQYDLALRIREFELVKVYNPSGDQSGMLLYTLDEGVKLAGAWGQDPLQSSAGQPGLDMGTGIPPLPQFAAIKRSALLDDIDGDGFISPGEILRYEIEITNVSRVPVDDMTLEDLLPPSVTYLPGTTTFTNENNVTVPIADATIGTPFPLDEGGITLPQSSLPALSTWRVKYDLQILPFENLPGGTVSIINLATVNSVVVTDPVNLESIEPILGRIGDFVWFDTNGNGIRDSGEPGINGVTVNLLNPDGSPALNGNGNVLTTVTANNGNGNPGFYVFLGVPAGDYIVEFVPPAQYVATTQNADNAGVNGPNNSDPNPATGRSPVFSLAGGEHNFNLDAGLIDASFIGDYVWLDVNGDGIQNPGEPGLNGVVVNLLDASGNPVLNGFSNPITTITANDSNGNPGYYQFGNLFEGTYIVEFVLPPGHAFTTQNADSQGILGGAVNSDSNPVTGRTNSFTVSAGSGTSNVDAGLLSADIAVNKTASPEATNEGAPVTFTVTVTNFGPTATTGVVITDALPAGLTFVNASANQGSYNSGNGQWTVGNMALNATATLTLTATANVGTVGQTIANTASVSASSAPDPVSGNNSDTASVSVSALQITKTSDATGPVNHGDTITYTIEVENLGANTISGVNVQDVLPPGLTYVANSVDASLSPIPPSGPVTQTINTTGAGTFIVPTGVTTLTVAAWGGGGGGAASGTNDAGGAGGGGAYARLNGLSVTPGGSLNYFVGPGGGLPGAGNPGQPGQATWFGSTSTLLARGGVGGGVGTISSSGAGGAASTSVGDVRWSGGNGGSGLTSSPPSERGGGGGGGSAFATANGNNGGNGARNSPGAGGTGTGNGGNGGQSGTIQAQSGIAPGGGGGGCGGAGAGAGAAGRLVISYVLPPLVGTTGAPPNLASGWTLEPGTVLTVTFQATLASNVIATEINNIATATSDDDPVPVTASVNDPVNGATLGDFVWQDLNGNGIQDAGEPGLAGVQVSLRDGSNNVLTTITSDSNGGYSFTGLPPGTYSVQFILPAGYVFAPQNADAQGVNGSINSDAATTTGITPSVTLAAGETNNNLDAGAFLQKCPDGWSEWQEKWDEILNGETAPAQNPDGDRYSNLIEYAFCLPPHLGIRKPFCLTASIETDGGVDGVYSRTAIGGAKDVTYVLEWTAQLANPTQWLPVNSVVLDANNTLVTNNGDGTETVRIPNLEGLTGLTSGTGFVRIRVDLDDGQSEATDSTEVLGWQQTEFDLCCTTYSNPFLECAVFTGTVDGVDGQNLEFASGAAGFDLSTILEAGVAYYIEVETGTLEGHRFDLTGGGEAFLSLANDSDLFAFGDPHNTLVSAAPAALQGSRIAVHRHRTLDTMFPGAAFNGTIDSTTADRVQFNVSGQWFNYWLFQDAQGAPIWTTTENVNLDDFGGLVIPPGRGMFLDNRGNQIANVMAFGEVREHDFVNPLAQGRNLTAGGYPVDQSARGASSRELNRANGLFGSRDFKTADSIFRWRPDINSSLSGYDTYFLLHRPSPAIERWVRQNDASLMPRDNETIFARDRSIFIRLKDPNFQYRIPAPWSVQPFPNPNSLNALKQQNSNHLKHLE